MGLFTRFLKKPGSRIDPETIDRTHYDRPADCYEAAAREALNAMPEDEHIFLVLRYGLTGRDPLPVGRICSLMNISMMRALDLGTGVELRLRNNAGICEAMQNLVSLEIADIADLHRTLSAMRDTNRADQLMRGWVMRRRPLRRLAMETFLEGGFRELLARSAVLCKSNTAMPAYGQGSDCGAFPAINSSRAL